MSAARGSSILIRLFRLITFQAAKNTIALDMTNRIIKSLDCREIILIFCILQVDFAISIITLFVIFDESSHKALVYKSVCVINIAHLIVLSAFKNPLFDAYFNRITALLAGLLYPFMRAYLRPSPGIDICIFRVRINISDNALFGFRRPYFEFFFPFLHKTKKINRFFHNLKKPKISDFPGISHFSEFHFFRNFRFFRITEFSF